MNLKPNHIGYFAIKDIPLDEIIPYIHWAFFFMAWKIKGRFDGIHTATDCIACQTSWLQTFAQEDRPKAKEALKLYRDSQEILQKFRDSKALTINASLGIYAAHSSEEDIIINHNNKEHLIPTLRQQSPANDGFCYALADFVNPKGDYVGAFANTVLGAEEFAAPYEKGDDMYTAFLIKILAERLAEGTAEWLHYKVRTHYWGYAPDEKEDQAEMLKERYKGIRPAVGYPSLPDQSIIFELDPLLNFSEIGISLTENGAMYPNASVCGMYFAHPQSRYFNIGKIDDQQLQIYAQKRNKTVEEMRKWLAANV